MKAAQWLALIASALAAGAAADTGSSRSRESALARQVAFLEEQQFVELSGGKGRETRELCYTAGKRAFTATFAVPASAVLETAIGVDPLARDLAVTQASFDVSLAVGSAEAQLIYHKRMPLPEDPRARSGWTQIEIDLGPYAGRTLRLTFAKRSDGQARSCDGRRLTPTDFVYWAKPQVRPRRLEGKPNVILVSLDTVRADHLGFMGYHRDTSPNLDRLAAQGCFFKTAVSQAPWTTPSHMSLFTSTYPRVHGGDQRLEDFPRRWNRALPTMACLLRERGYVTGAFTGWGSISPRFGFMKGFDFYVMSGAPRTDVANVFGKALPWLRQNAGRTFFLFVHTYEAHSPYCDPYFTDREGIEESDEIAWRTALYDGDIRKADAFVGRLLDELDALGLADTTLLIVTSDHGEHLAGTRTPPDARMSTGHGFNLYDELLLVPLVLRGPGMPRRANGVGGQVRLIDVLPTVLDYVGLPMAPSFQGRSLRQAIENGSCPDRPAFSEGVGLGFPRESLRHNGLKYVHRLSDEQHGAIWMGKPPEHELYDLASDPGERRNLATDRPELVKTYRGLLESLLVGVARFAPKEPADAAGIAKEDDPELRDALRALGYLE